jgi:hypothetical protein
MVRFLMAPVVGGEAVRRRFIHRTLPIITAMSMALPVAMTQSKGSADTCVAPAIPLDIQDHLKTNYVSWKVKQPSDFWPLSNPESEREAWLWFKQRRCPGIAVGGFQPGADTIYAFLLVPATTRVSGSRLVIVKRVAGSAIASQVIAKRPDGEDWPNADYFIRSVKLDPYAGRRWKTSPEMKEGILIYGAGHGLFFWESGRYVLEFTDEVDRDQ